MSEICHQCGGEGGFDYTDWECCGHYLPTGECCAAIYGQDRLVPIVTREPCTWCGGSGQEPPSNDPVHIAAERREGDS
jgi:hypothetical protein